MTRTTAREQRMEQWVNRRNAHHLMAIITGTLEVSLNLKLQRYRRCLHYHAQWAGGRA